VPAEVAEAIAQHRRLFDLDRPDSAFAIALRWRGVPEYRRLRALADGIAAGLGDRIAGRQPLYVMLEGDAALTLGAILKEDLGLASEVLVIDGLVLRDFDFVDIGRVRMPSHTVPVTIKSLVFGSSRAPAIDDTRDTTA
jgi:ethanolamine utilization protein EutA